MQLRGENPAVWTLTPPEAPALPGEVALISATLAALILEPPSIYARGNQDEKAGTGTTWDCGWCRGALAVAVCRLVIRDGCGSSGVSAECGSRIKSHTCPADEAIG